MRERARVMAVGGQESSGEVRGRTPVQESLLLVLLLMAGEQRRSQCSELRNRGQRPEQDEGTEGTAPARANSPRLAGEERWAELYRREHTS